MLDAILSPAWESRYYSFNAHWGDDEAMASMRNGSGDEWFLLFAPWGAALKGLVHESALARDRTFPDRVRHALPASFAPFLHEPAFCQDQASFCLWREPSDAAWSAVPSAKGDLPSPDEDGSAELLAILDGQPETYHDWAEGYYERTVLLSGIRAVYEHRPLDRALLDLLAPECALADLAADASVGCLRVFAGASQSFYPFQINHAAKAVDHVAFIARDDVAVAALQDVRSVIRP